MSNTPVWDDLVDAATLAKLQPGIPDDLDRRPDVLVVGAGILGLATAEACRRAGAASVVVLERDRVAAAASGRAAGLLTPGSRPWQDPPEVVALARASFARYRDLDAEWDGEIGVRVLDWLTVLPFALPDDFTPEPPVESLDSAALTAIEPAVAGGTSGLYVRGQGHVNPVRLAAALAARAGTIATGVDVTPPRADTSSVTTSAGDFSPGALVWTTGLAALPQLTIRPQLGEHWIKGHLIATAPAPFTLRVALSTPEGLVVQLTDGRLVAGGTQHPDDLTPDPVPEVTDDIAARLAALVPAARDLPVTHRWCCFRPVTGDHQPVIDRVPGRSDAWFTSGHYATGILQAAATGAALAEWITRGRRPAAVATLGLDRFEAHAGR